VRPVVFDTLSERLQSIFRSLRGQGTLSTEQVEAALREIRLALLEADVHFRVVKQFLERIRLRAVGQDVLKSLTPDQAVLRVVRDEMIEVLGGDVPQGLVAAAKPPSSILLAGLQGSGKTTTAAKLAHWLKGRGHHPLLVSTDVYRPAAREQLRSFATKAGLVVHQPATDDPAAIVRSALGEARSIGHDWVLIDTAGRLHIDDELMAELAELKKLAEPTEVLYVADAMTGQDAVRSAEEFERRIGLTGIVLTKLDGDARGGADLSAAAVTGKPVKFAGVSEGIQGLEPFQPSRIVGRLLGMGDVLGLIEKVEAAFDRDQAEALVKKVQRSEFSLADYRDQMAQIRKLGSLESVLSMIPGVRGALRGVDTESGDKDIRRSIAIIDSMTQRERLDPSVLNGSRRKRIARGSGHSVESVNRLLKQYAQARKLMKGLSGGGGGMRRLAARMSQFG
jgi:signal recognition particle subunit SRP54